MRCPRLASVTGIYHVMIRGVNKQDIFWDEEDRKKFLSNLKTTKEKYMYQLYAYCLMPNHVHLLIKHKEKDILAKIMQSLSVRYSIHINKKYDRVGHLFQGRYLSKAVNTNAQVLRVQRYVHQNPEKAGIEKMSKYAWSSYNQYMKDDSGIVDTKYVLNLLAEDTKSAKEAFCNYNNENIMIKDEVEYEFKRYYSDEEFIEILKNELKTQNLYEIQKYNNKILKELIKKIKQIKGTNSKQISRVLGIERKIIDRIN